MLKKASWILIGVVVLSLVFGGLALAEDNTPPTETGTRWGGGVVTAKGSDNFTIHNRLGRDQTIYVDSSTQFTDQDVKPSTFSALKVGDIVIGAASRRDDGKWYALLVHILPPPTHYAGVGTVDSVASDSFDFTNRQGRQWEFYVDSNTKVYQGRDNTPLSFSEVKTGSHLFVQAELRSDNKWWATVIRIVPDSFPGGGPKPGGDPNADGNS